MKRHNKKITSKEFDERFDKGEDMAEFLDVKKAQEISGAPLIKIPPIFLEDPHCIY